ncbi:hypothetical protein [Streptomyces sp. NPDC003720]|uniref:hypothetical protein n=1 Tax=Streptomyces sp. NPDC003720 TaxID=3364684 RepID=UPI003679BA12
MDVLDARRRGAGRTAPRWWRGRRPAGCQKSDGRSSRPAWQGGTFVADLYVVTTPHRVRLVVDAEAGTARATWSTVPLTGPSLEVHVRSPLMTRPDVA